ncbi:DegT/DnrJ/EryC1/StrS family aminotransferase [Coralliovum pocilloporae]|uniref:DegT/DnrJ/EryC1/StrS family aminotransferase n=1 Tax=Coralliovum pocilloporae TaxID=3066369 RepID=UPI0033070A27
MTDGPVTSVPFLEPRKAYLELKEDIDQAIERVLLSGQYIGGRELETFEQAFAAYSDAEFCVGVGNGLDALRLALLALDIGQGDEVIVPVHTFVATWLGVDQVGAKVVPVSCSEDYTIDPVAIEAAITSRTKAIMPVHLYGQACDLDAIQNIARKHDLHVIEDAAQCQGVRSDSGRRIGGISAVTCWSFYPGKNLGALGDGGAVTTDDKNIADRIRELGNYGSRQKYVHNELGVNSRLDPLQAAILTEKLKVLDDWNQRRKALAQRYLDGLRDTPGLDLPVVNRDHVWHLFPVRLDQTLRDRNTFLDQLHSNGVNTVIHYPILPCDQQCYQGRTDWSDRFHTERRWTETLFSLPISPHHTNEDIDFVIRQIKATFQRSS